MTQYLKEKKWNAFEHENVVVTHLKKLSHCLFHWEEEEGEKKNGSFVFAPFTFTFFFFFAEGENSSRWAEVSGKLAPKKVALWYEAKVPWLSLHLTMNNSAFIRERGKLQIGFKIVQIQISGEIIVITSFYPLFLFGDQRWANPILASEMQYEN